MKTISIIIILTAEYYYYLDCRLLSLFVNVNCSVVHSYSLNFLKFEMAYLHPMSGPGGWGSRIHRELLSRRIAPPHNESPVDDSNQSDAEDLVMMELWGMQSTPSLPSLPCPLWSGVIAPNRVLSMGQIELNCLLMLN